MIEKGSTGIVTSMMNEQMVNLNLPSCEVREARLLLADDFLDRLLRCMGEGTLTSSGQIAELYAAFKREHSCIGNDFSLSHTWQAAWKRDLVEQCRAQEQSEQLPPQAAQLRAVLTLLTEIVFGHQSE